MKYPPNTREPCSITKERLMWLRKILSHYLKKIYSFRADVIPS